MTKLFMGLVLFTFIGAGVLFFLLRSMPSDRSAKTDNDVAKSEKKENADDANVVKAEPETSTEDLTAKETSIGSENKNDFVERKLTIRTEPTNAKVFRGGDFLGETPVEVVVDESAAELRVLTAGFQEYRRQMPKASTLEPGQLLTWNIELRPDVKTDVKPETPEKIPEKSEPQEESKPKVASPKRAAPGATQGPAFLPKGVHGVSWIQMKSVPEGEATAAVAEVASLKDTLLMNIRLCRVELAGRGKWIRFLAGPFESSAEAGRFLWAVREKSPDAIVTGKQKCL